MKFLPVVSLFLLSWSGTTFADQDGSAVTVVVFEDSDAILPCSLSTGENIEWKRFDWKKDGRQEVFLYDAGLNYNNGRPGEVEQFKSRISHFPDELKNGNASIKITKTKVADGGNYTCIFLHLQPERRFLIQLVVEPILKDRSEEHIPGAAPKPSVKTLDQTEDSALLQCKVRGASPKPKVEWKDSFGNIVPAEKPQVSERGGSYDVILQANVTKTDRYSCVSKQEEIYHQTHAEIYVHLNGPLELVVGEGNDVILPCSLSTKENIELKAFTWITDGQKQVFSYDAGIHSNNGRPGQVEQFKGRVSYFRDELKNGDASIKITNTMLTDSGSYSCVLQSETRHIQFVVRSAVKVVVREDSDAILPCSLSPAENIESKLFDWKKDGGMEVLMYDGKVTDKTNEQFKSRVSHFPDELKYGNASIKITKTEVNDSGDYTCIFPRLQPERRFLIQLVVEQILTS